MVAPPFSLHLQLYNQTIKFWPHSLEHTASEPTTKPKLHFPSSDEDWEKANYFFESDVVPQVLVEPSVDSKYTVLTEGVYTYFATNLGTSKAGCWHRERLNKHRSTLASLVNEAKLLKGKARHEFCDVLNAFLF